MKREEQWLANYERLKAENPDNLYYVTSENLDGVEIARYPLITGEQIRWQNA